MEEILIVEEWRNISGYLNYQVSNIGRVRNTDSGRILKLPTNCDGYYYVGLSLNGKKTQYQVHRLVALEFIPNPSNKTTVDHIKNKAIQNNNVENLRWATRKEQRWNISTHINTSSKYKGVSLNKSTGEWRSRILVDNKHIHLGYFKSEEEAALAYNKKANEHFGEFANLNVIEYRLAAAEHSAPVFLNEQKY